MKLYLLYVDGYRQEPQRCVELSKEDIDWLNALSPHKEIRDWTTVVFDKLAKEYLAVRPCDCGLDCKCALEGFTLN